MSGCKHRKANLRMGVVKNSASHTLGKSGSMVVSPWKRWWIKWYFWNVLQPFRSPMKRDRAHAKLSRVSAAAFQLAFWETNRFFGWRQKKNWIFENPKSGGGEERRQPEATQPIQTAGVWRFSIERRCVNRKSEEGHVQGGEQRGKAGITTEERKGNEPSPA